MTASRISINDEILTFGKVQTRKLIEERPILGFVPISSI